MNILAQAQFDDAAIRSSIQSLQAIYAIVIALAIGEAFKQFVADKADLPEDRRIHWSRLPALVSFLFLVVPFYHGMVRYFFDVYTGRSRPSPYPLFLIIDCFVFTVEASLFFVLSRSLPHVQWRRFYFTVMLLLVVDVAWDISVWKTHTAAPLYWAYANAPVILLLGVILRMIRNERSRLGPALALALIIGRSGVDYWLNWSLYFPPEQVATLPISNSVATTKPVVYIASPYSKGDPVTNARFQCKVFDKMLSDGKAWPVAPLWSHFQNQLYPRPYGDWIKYDNALLERYDACLRLSAEVPELGYTQSESSGADKEVRLFREQGKPIFFSLEALYKWIDSKRRAPGS